MSDTPEKPVLSAVPSLPAEDNVTPLRHEPTAEEVIRQITARDPFMGKMAEALLPVIVSLNKQEQRQEETLNIRVRATKLQEIDVLLKVHSHTTICAMTGIPKSALERAIGKCLKDILFEELDEESQTAAASASAPPIRFAPEPDAD